MTLGDWSSIHLRLLLNIRKWDNFIENNFWKMACFLENIITKTKRNYHVSQGKKGKLVQDKRGNRNGSWGGLWCMSLLFSGMLLGLIHRYNILHRRSHSCISEYIGALMKKYNKWLYGWFCMTKSTTNICKRESIKEKKKTFWC